MATKKKHLKEIARRAAEVPQVDLKTGEVHKVLGAELIYQGMTEIDGQPIVPGLMYNHKMPVLLAVNHKRRMKKVFKQYGNEGLLAYYDRVDEANGIAPPPREVARAMQPEIFNT